MRLLLRTLGVLLLVNPANLSSSQDNVGVPPAVVDSWSYLIGDWNVEGRVGEATVNGTASFEWAANKSCYFGKQAWSINERGRKVELALIGGWDAVANETIEQGFSSSGRAATVHYQAPAEGANVIEGRTDGVTGLGARWFGTIKLERTGPDEFQLTSTIDGKVVHSLKYVRNKAAP